MQRNTIFSVATAMALSVGAVACGSDATVVDSAGTRASATGDAAGAELTISDARSREPAAGTTLGVVYGVVSNPGDDDVQIESATADVDGTVELHDVEMVDGAMSMFESPDGFTVPAGGDFTFEPGGPHIMLLGIDPAAFPDEIEVTLNLSAGGPLVFTAPVESIGDGMDEMEMRDDS